VDHRGPNGSIVRIVSGRYEYVAASSGERRGSEEFRLFVHPDGTRQLLMWHDLTARQAQFSVLLRVDAGYRPLEAYVSYWNAARYKGSTLFRLRGQQLFAEYADANGAVEQRTLDVGDRFSLGTHPVAGDGWHLARMDAKGAASQTLRLVSVEASADMSRPIFGTLVDMPAERLGRERVRVPAGEFDTTRYRLAGANDLWIADEDWIVVKSVSPRQDREYRLVSLTRLEGQL
jgi:hypothetical protein